MRKPLPFSDIKPIFTLKFLTLNKHVLASCRSFIFTQILNIHKLPAKDRSNVWVCVDAVWVVCCWKRLVFLCLELPRWIRICSFLCGQRPVSCPDSVPQLWLTCFISFISFTSRFCVLLRFHHSSHRPCQLPIILLWALFQMQSSRLQCYLYFVFSCVL